MCVLVPNVLQMHWEPHILFSWSVDEMATLSIRNAYIAGEFGSVVGVAAGMLSIIIFVANEAAYGMLQGIRDILWIMWPAFQGLGFVGLFREYRIQSARLAFLFALITAIAQACLVVVLATIGLPQAMTSLWAALGLTLTSILAVTALTFMMISGGIALMRTSQHVRLRRLSSCAGYICMVTGILILSPLVQGLVFIPNLLLALLFASEIGSE